MLRAMDRGKAAGMTNVSHLQPVVVGPKGESAEVRSGRVGRVRRGARGGKRGTRGPVVMVAVASAASDSVDIELERVNRISPRLFLSLSLSPIHPMGVSQSRDYYYYRLLTTSSQDDRFCYLHLADSLAQHLLDEADERLGWDLPDDGKYTLRIDTALRLMSYLPRHQGPSTPPPTVSRRRR